jgi:ribonuclease T1
MKRHIFFILLLIFSIFQDACKPANTKEKTTYTETSKSDSPQQSSDTDNNTKSKGKRTKGNPSVDDTQAPNESNTKIPAKVYKLLSYIKANGEAPDGYVGGRIFQNREGRLDKRNAEGKKITYQEWDVNPKKRGKNRGAERLVTGSDGRSWYTNDHYDTFTEVKE